MKKNISSYRILFKCIATLSLLTNLACSSSFDLTKAPKPENLNSYDEFINKNAPDEDAFVAVQRLAEPFIIEKQWDNAIGIYRNYAPLFPAYVNQINKIISILEAAYEELIVTNLGPNINTKAGEYSPVFTTDESRMYFTGQDRTNGAGSEDIFYADFENGTWLRANNIGNKINTNRRNESLDGISADGNRLFLFGNYSDNFGQGDIYFVDKTKDGWGELEHFPAPINTRYFESNATMSGDGKVLIFNSDRPEGIGDYVQKGVPFHGGYMGNVDIYVSIKTENGWGTPINLGKTINTPFCEYSAFLHPDGKTLYFSSDGHPGLGRLDVFKSERLDENSWTKWSEPVNLGKQINTPGHDWGYRISTSGKLAYFSASGKVDSYGEEDIYTITVPEKVRPNPVAIVKGIVTDDQNNPLEADLVWEDLTSGVQIGILKSDPINGSYIIVLQLDKKYGVFASKTGYYPDSKNIDLLGIMESQNITENIKLNSIKEIIKTEVAIVLNNIFFEYDKYVLLPESFPELNRLAKILKDYPKSNVEILGHTDSNGSDEYNQVLSEKRAQAVVEYLISIGCNSQMISATGYGESKPIDTNETAEGQAKNRRVEFKFLKE